MTEERVYFNSEHFKDNGGETLAQTSTIKYEIKQLVLKQIKIKIHCAYLIKDKKNYENIFQNEYYNITKDCETFGDAKLSWDNSSIREKLQKDFFLLKEQIKIAQKELRAIKDSIKDKNRILNKI